MRVVLDTDIGGDFDDINALLLLCASPEVELVAVTTVGAGASAVKRAQVAKTFLARAGRPEVPVFAGYDQPERPNSVLSSLSPEHCLNAWTAEMADAVVEPIHAAEALPRLAADDVQLLSIGAMTNIAAAIRGDDAAMHRFGGVVAMGGAFRSQLREANVVIDPEAADTVYRSGIPLRTVGVEEASKSTLPLSAYGALEGRSSTLSLLADAARRYAAAYRTDKVTLYDVTAVAALLRPEWFRFESLTVAIELVGAASRGMTIVETDPLFNSVPHGTTVSVAVESDPELIAELFRNRVLNGELP